MDSKELQERIARWEGLHTEFKERIGSSNELAMDLVCLANTDGGQLIIGVAEDRTIAGVEDADAVHQLVDNVAYNNCEPPLSVIQEVVELGEARVVVVNVPKGAQRPYRTNQGKYYTRTTSGCRHASREELLRLFQAVGSIFYDETPLMRLSLSDLDLDALDLYLKETGQSDLQIEPERLLENWGLLSDGHPTIAGAILFGRRPQQYLPFAQINAVRFAGTDSSGDPMDRKDLKGRLLDVIEQAERFLDLHLLTPHRIRGFKPEAHPEMPKAALREAVVNALAHRDYTVQGPVRLFIFANRIEVHTPGKPPNSVDAEAMKAGVHVVRNPHIYTRLADAGLVTRAGTGIRRIIRLVREATGKELEIILRDYELVLIIPRKEEA